MKGRPLIALLLLLLVGGYGYRAVVGIRAGLALDEGHLLRNSSDYDDAAPMLERAAVGFNTTRALLMAGAARVDEWEREVSRYSSRGADTGWLLDAGRNYLTCRCLAPAAREAWKGLGEVYEALEYIERERRAERPWQPKSNPWLGIGRQGRAAVGMLREALDVSQNWSALHDRLALVLWAFGADDEAREAVRSSAQTLPIYHRHKYYFLSKLPPWFAEEFADASREVLGEVPLFPRTAHLIELGKLERRLRRNEQAIASFREALEGGVDAVRVAEASFHLGLALMEEERLDEARSHMETAAAHPVFREAGLSSLARIASMEGKDAEALEFLRQLRWEDPDELEPCLEFAAVASRMENWQAALEALRWAKLNHPDEFAPYRQLVRVQLAMGDRAAAQATIVELQSSSHWAGSAELATLLGEFARAAAAE